MPYVKKDPAEVRKVRQAAAAKSAEARRKKAKESKRPREITVKIYADDAEELARMAAEAHQSRIQFIRDLVRGLRKEG